MTLGDLVNSGKPWAAKRAQMALEIQEQLNAGNLSPDEAAELLEDLIRTDALEKEADDIETKAMLVSAITTIAKFV